MAILRWVLFLPASFVSVLIVDLLVRWYRIASWPFTISDSTSNMIQSAMAGFAFVLAGALVAPKHNTPVAIVLTVLYAIIQTFLMLASLHFVQQGMISLWETLLGFALGVGSAVVACFKIYLNKDDLE